MGDELSCPCGNRHELEQETKKATSGEEDIIKEVMKGKLSKDQILYEYACSNKMRASKICLIGTNSLEGFFSNRNLLIIEEKHEINLYYNTIFITNFLNQVSLTCIILQYTRGNEDRTSLYIKPPGSRRSTKSDYSAIYKVESINFVSNDNEKIKEQILNDLYSQLKKSYRFFGIITDSAHAVTDLDESLKSFNNAMKASKIQKNYKILYKKSRLTDNLEIKYSVDILNEALSSDSIMKVLGNNRDKILKSVIKEENPDSGYPYSYFFIFEGNKTTPEFNESEFLVVKIEKDKTTPDSFLKDIAEKINLQEGAELLSVVNDRNGFFLVFKYDITLMDDDDE